MALRKFLHDLAENHLRTVITSGWQVVAAEPCELESRSSDDTPGQRGTSNVTMDSDMAAHSAEHDSDLAVSNSRGGGIMSLLEDDSGPDSAQAQASHTRLVRIDRGFAQEACCAGGKTRTLQRPSASQLRQMHNGSGPEERYLEGRNAGYSAAYGRIVEDI